MLHHYVIIIIIIIIIIIGTVSGAHGVAALQKRLGPAHSVQLHPQPRAGADNANIIWCNII